jgi:hypothetical protein
MDTILEQIKQCTTGAECMKNIKTLNMIILESLIEKSLELLKIGGVNILMHAKEQFPEDIALNVCCYAKFKIYDSLGFDFIVIINDLHLS